VNRQKLGFYAGFPLQPVKQASGLNRLAAGPIGRRGHDEHANRF